MLWNSLLEIMSGHCALMVTTCKVWGSALVRQPICSTLTRQNVATLRVIQTVMNTVTVKMSHIPSTIKVGASANRRATTWLASTKATATIFIASKNFDAARWKKVNLITTWKVSEYSKNSKYAMGNFTEKDVGNRICTFLYTIIHVRSFQRCKSLKHVGRWFLCELTVKPMTLPVFLQLSRQIISQGGRVQDLKCGESVILLRTALVT